MLSLSVPQLLLYFVLPSPGVVATFTTELLVFNNLGTVNVVFSEWQGCHRCPVVVKIDGFLGTFPGVLVAECHMVVA